MRTVPEQTGIIPPPRGAVTPESPPPGRAVIVNKTDLQDNVVQELVSIYVRPRRRNPPAWPGSVVVQD
jgi:hypothetical protein